MIWLHFKEEKSFYTYRVYGQLLNKNFLSHQYSHCTYFAATACVRTQECVNLITVFQFQTCKVRNFQNWDRFQTNKLFPLYRLFFLRLIAQFFYTNLHELFCQFIHWTNWVNSGKSKDNIWISCQVMVDMEKVYDDLLIINL